MYQSPVSPRITQVAQWFSDKAHSDRNLNIRECSDSRLQGQMRTPSHRTEHYSSMHAHLTFGSNLSISCQNGRGSYKETDLEEPGQILTAPRFSLLWGHISVRRSSSLRCQWELELQARSSARGRPLLNSGLSLRLAPGRPGQVYYSAVRSLGVLVCESLNTVAPRSSGVSAARQT
jgi:hypothetical protein